MSDKSNSPLKTLNDQAASLKRGSAKSLSAYLKLIHDEDIRANQTRLLIKFVRVGPDKEPRTKDLCDWLKNTITEYVHPRSRIEEAKNKNDEENVTEYTNELMDQAKEVFTDVLTSGEFGELLIYALLERFLQLPQIVTKMDLKTNFRMHFHGADGVHLDPDSKKPVLIISESKLKKDMGTAITECIQSIEKILSGKDTDGSSILQKEIYVIRNHLNVFDGELQSAIREILDKKSPFYNDLELRAAGLVCFNYDEYKDKSEENLTADITSQINAWKQAYLTRLQSHRKKDFEFIFFLIPLPSVDAIRDEFRLVLGK